MVLSIRTYIPVIPVISRPSTIFQFSLKNTERLLGKSSAWEIFVILLDQLQSNCVTLKCAEGINRSLKQHVIFWRRCSIPCFSCCTDINVSDFYYTGSISWYRSSLYVDLLFDADYLGYLQGLITFHLSHVFPYSSFLFVCN